MNILNGATTYFETLGRSVDQINYNVDGLVTAFNFAVIVGGVMLALLFLMVIWQGMTIGSLERKLNRIEDMIMVRGIKDEGFNSK